MQRVYDRRERLFGCIDISKRTTERHVVIYAPDAVVRRISRKTLAGDDFFKPRKARESVDA